MRRALDARGHRVLPVAKQSRRKMRQCRQVIDRITAMVHRIAQDGAEFARKRAVDHALALDQAGIAVARLLAHAPAIDEDDVAAPLLQVQRDANSYLDAWPADYIRPRGDRDNNVSGDRDGSATCLISTTNPNFGRYTGVLASSTSASLLNIAAFGAASAQRRIDRPGSIVTEKQIPSAVSQYRTLFGPTAGRGGD